MHLFLLLPHHLCLRLNFLQHLLSRLLYFGINLLLFVFITQHAFSSFPGFLHFAVGCLFFSLEKRYTVSKQLYGWLFWNTGFSHFEEWVVGWLSIRRHIYTWWVYVVVDVYEVIRRWTVFYWYWHLFLNACYAVPRERLGNICWWVWGQYLALINRIPLRNPG